MEDRGGLNPHTTRYPGILRATPHTDYRGPRPAADHPPHQKPTHRVELAPASREKEGGHFVLSDRVDSLCWECYEGRPTAIYYRIPLLKAATLLWWITYPKSSHNVGNAAIATYRYRVLKATLVLLLPAYSTSPPRQEGSRSQNYISIYFQVYVRYATVDRPGSTRSNERQARQGRFRGSPRPKDRGVRSGPHVPAIARRDPPVRSLEDCVSGALLSRPARSWYRQADVRSAWGLGGALDGLGGM